MKNIIVLFAALLLGTFMAYGQSFSSEIAVEKNEKWWGAFVSNSPAQPFMAPVSVATGQYSDNGNYTVSMLVSSNGRYIWSSRPMQIDISPDRISIRSAHEKVGVVKAGKGLREAYLVCCHKNFPPQHGKKLPYELFTAPVYETALEFGYDLTQQKLLSFADRIISEKLPVGTIAVSAGWQDENGTLEFDRNFFPDPKAMIDQLHAKGFKIMLTVTPLVPASGRSYFNHIGSGALLLNNENKPLIVEHQGGYSACIDITKASSGASFKTQIASLHRSYDVDGIRFDCRSILALFNRPEQRERFIEEWLKLGEGIELCEFLPGNSSQFNASVYAIHGERGQGWSYLEKQVENVIHSSLVGFPYLHMVPDSYDPRTLFNDQLLMARSLEVSMLMPVASVDFAPWRITNPELAQNVKETIRLRGELHNYIRETLEKSLYTAEPLVRHMEYQFPRNGFSDCDDQFMLGESYLVAPVTSRESSRMVRLPRGRWQDPKGRIHKGPRVIGVDMKNGEIPIYKLVK